MARQIDLICAPQLKSAERLNGHAGKAARCTFSLVSSITQRDAICRRSLLPGESLRRDRSGGRRRAKCRLCCTNGPVAAD